MWKTVNAAHNGGALVFAPFFFCGSLVAWAAGRNRRLVRAVVVGPLGGADRGLVGSAIGVAQLVNAHGDTRQVLHTRKESSQDTEWPLTTSGGASRTDQKVSRKVL